MENYLWKYVDKLDGTIEVASEKIMEQIDKYVLGEDENKKGKETIESEEEKNK